MSAEHIDHPHLIGSGLATLAVIAASVGFGLVPYFARSLTAEGMAPHSIAFYRYAFAATVLLPFVWRARARWTALLWGIVAGVSMGVGWIGYVRAVEIAPVSTVGVLYMTYPVFTLMIAWLVFGDTPSRRAILASLMIVAAAALATSPGAITPDQVPALVLSLAAPLGFGFGINVLVHKLTVLKPVVRIACVSLGSVLGLLPLMVATPVAALLPVTVSGWWLVAGIAFGSALVPQLLYTVAAPVIGTARTAIAGSFELPTMFLVGWFAFGEPVGGAQWIACVIVISAIALTPGKSIRSVAANIAVERKEP
ncbi:putative permease [Hoeflea sp. IMCC20628]|uniref:DMT family transporter n=1 Tax=Hoeflea sp. IMCC20628 TaxID=1620421 RepID=UPI00063A8A59|nr:DMT family transporter [Hoeflea sp. IMCC20628]AKH99352.1 putative permease [Hoeflea sp. IMCC20628]